MSNIPSPRFNLKNPQSKDKSLIYLVYRYRGQKMKYSTGSTIKVSEWDFKNQRPIERVGRQDLLSLGRKLDDLAFYAKEVYIEHNYGDLSLRSFRSAIDERVKNEHRIGRSLKNGSEKQAISFLEFIELELAEMKATNMKASSYKMFKNQVRVLKDFAKVQGTYTYEDINWTFRLQLIDWLSSKNVQLSYGNKTLSTLSQFMERARRKGLHTQTEHQVQGWQVSALKAPKTKITFSMHELDQLAEMQLGGFLKKVRDLLLVGIGTGQRFSDFSRLRPEDFYKTMSGIPILSVISQKTGTPAKIPLNIFSWHVPLLEEYEYHSPELSMQKFNQGLKVLCKQAGFHEKVLVVEQYMGRKPRIEKRFVPKYEMISSHTCRRTFVTILYRIGYTLSQIMLMTGHSTESQLRLYIGIDAEQNAEQIGLAIERKNKQQVS